MPIANTRNGTRIEYGSSSKPKAVSRPSCQITAAIVTPSTISVLRQQRVYQYSSATEITTATPKNIITATRPSTRSPTIFAKPVMWIRMPSRWNLSRISSRRCENSNRLSRSPVSASVCAIGTRIAAERRSLATRLPTRPARSTFSFTSSIDAGEPS